MRKLFLLPILILASLSSIAGENTGRFQLLVETLNEGGLGTAKCNTETGEGYYKMGDKWVKGKDDVAIPTGHYICDTQVFKDKGWLLYRMNVDTGETWTLEGDAWKKIEDK